MNRLSNWHRQGPNFERCKLGWRWVIVKPYADGWYWRAGQFGPAYGSCAKTLWGACSQANKKLRELGIV